MSERHLARLAEDALERLGDRDAVFFEGQWLRAAPLHERMCRVSAGLREAGVRPGDRVVVVMANCPEVALTYGALWRAGAVATPAIFLLPPGELRHIVTDSGAVGVVTTAELLPGVRAAVEGLDLRWVVCVGDETDGVLPYAELEAAEPGGIVDRAAADPAALLYTGGTTGRAKGVLLSHRALWECGHAGHSASYVPGVVGTIMPLPLAHAFGLLVSVTGMHAVERTPVVLMRWFVPDEFLRLAAEHRMQRATLVPTMLRLLLDQPLEDHDLSALRLVTCGSAPLPVDLAQAFEARVPGVEVLEGYGLTETGGIATVNPPGARRLGSVGRPVPGYEVRIEPDDEISVRGPGLMSAYWNDDAATAAAMPDGWFRTGDLGRLDENGYLYVVDRKKDLVIRGGFNVHPRDVEDALLAHDAVAGAGVVGRPDPVLGEAVVAFVALAPGSTASPEELAAHCVELLGKHKRVDEVRVVDAIPLTPIGKTDRKALRGRI